MKKKEFQKEAAYRLLSAMTDIYQRCHMLPDYSATVKYGTLLVLVKEQGSRIKIKLTGSGRITYQLTDMLGNAGDEYLYYEYSSGDDHAAVTQKFGTDFGRLIEDFVLCGSLHDFTHMEFTYTSDISQALCEYEACREVL